VQRAASPSATSVAAGTLDSATCLILSLSAFQRLPTDVPSLRLGGARSTTLGAGTATAFVRVPRENVRASARKKKEKLGVIGAGWVAAPAFKSTQGLDLSV
jgi:hypothetical protein